MKESGRQQIAWQTDGISFQLRMTIGLKHVYWARFKRSPNGQVIGGIISHRIHVTGICSPTFSCLSAEN